MAMNHCTKGAFPTFGFHAGTILAAVFIFRPIKGNEEGLEDHAFHEMNELRLVVQAAYVHDDGARYSFPSDILCAVPWETVSVFEVWTRCILARLARHLGAEKIVRGHPSRKLGEDASSCDAGLGFGT